MNILVTGSAGFVGSDLVPKLINLGHTVFGIDIIEETHSNIYFKHDLMEEFRGEMPKIDVCIHLASSVGGIIYNISQLDITETNFKINENVINLCKKIGCKNVLFFSTINVFEISMSFEHKKLEEIDQKSAYATSKAKGERQFEDNFENLIVIRPTNIFGKNQVRRHNKFGESHVIPDLLKKIENSSQIEVFGDGSQLRNFIHVSDVNDFVIKNIGTKGIRYFNLRSNNTITIGKLVLELIKFKNKNININFKPEYLKYELFKIKDFDISYPNEFGFKAKINDICDGLTL